MQLLPLGVIADLAKAYTAPDRHFHNLDHISACLSELEDAMQHGVPIIDVEAIGIALWFHDVVYDGKRQDNEELSAAAAWDAVTRLGHSEAFAETVRRLVLVTKHSDAYPPASADEELICDIDLTSLAAEDFADNTMRIRQEYAHVSDEDFFPARRQVLAKFLERDRIYRTEFFFAKYESKARQNLATAT